MEAWFQDFLEKKKKNEDEDRRGTIETHSKTNYTLPGEKSPIPTLFMLWLGKEFGENSYTCLHSVCAGEELILVLHTECAGACLQEGNFRSPGWGHRREISHWLTLCVAMPVEWIGPELSEGTLGSVVRSAASLISLGCLAHFSYFSLISPFIC